jgi:hypothetical protein
MIHDHAQTVPGNILGQHLEVMVVLGRLGIMGSEGGNAGGQDNRPGDGQQTFLFKKRRHGVKN